MCAYSLDHITSRSLRSHGAGLVRIRHGFQDGRQKDLTKVKTKSALIPIALKIQIVKERCAGPCPNHHAARAHPCCVMIRHLARGWWSQAGSNRRPPACKAGALPAELWPRCVGGRPPFGDSGPRRDEAPKLVGLGRFELPTSPLSGVRSNQLSYRPGASCRPASHRITDCRCADCGRHPVAGGRPRNAGQMTKHPRTTGTPRAGNCSGR